MPELLLPLTASEVMKRLGINLHQLVHALRNGLKPYESSGESFDRQYRIYKLSNPGSSFPKDIDYETSDSRRLIESLMFSPSDVDEFVRNRQVNEAAPRSTSKPFPCKKGTGWSEVRITVIDDDNVKITTPEGQGNFHYSQLDLGDKRQAGKAKVLWDVLKVLAETREIDKEVSTPWRTGLSKHISRLDKHLQCVFGIEKDAIAPYRENKKYKPKFHLSDKRAVISEKHYENDEIRSIIDEECNKWGGNR